jgi:hypothetical protein
LTVLLVGHGDLLRLAADVLFSSFTALFSVAAAARIAAACFLRTVSQSEIFGFSHLSPPVQVETPDVPKS